MGISDSISKEASKYQTILAFASLVCVGTYGLTQKWDIAIIVSAITIIIIWLKVLTDDISKIKKKLKMEEAE